MGEEKQWLTYRDAAKRVQASHRTVRLWAQQGMPMEWRMIEGQRTRVVELDVLLSFWRERMQTTAFHFYRVRKRAAEAGVVLETPEAVRAKRLKASETRRGIRAAETPESAGFGRTEPETTTPEPNVDPLADMTPLKGSAEYYALTERVRTTTPRCAGMPEYTGDRISPEDSERLAGICAGCPLPAEREAFASASKPTGGFWPVGATQAHSVACAESAETPSG
ncbi:hypothetical protein [Microbacterium sp. NPDC087665]|uniref:hypothetical protein n=1 Tax=Microbacterium sp. NPDC087665 TaxID=3364194 RepID=UPI0037F3B969